eukprot:TRINITY_DN5414_c0_g1_i1.p1 TRINITY_DN5414_c0_g1~~TRINITY_DN5414_c0_g1_i1.p1  ORF type:complete len:610 (-),score=193.78 TRINITY_DN5414_c0_g1_i1:24-1853(-)
MPSKMEIDGTTKVDNKKEKVEKNKKQVEKESVDSEKPQKKSTEGKQKRKEKKAKKASMDIEKTEEKSNVEPELKEEKKEKKEKKDKKQKRKREEEDKKEKKQKTETASPKKKKEKKPKLEQSEEIKKEDPVQVPVQTPKKAAPTKMAFGSGMGSTPFKKDFYKEHSAMKNFTQTEVDQFRQENEMTVNGSNCKPIRTFAESGFPEDMLVCCKSFAKPTPIQSQCWPIILSGNDIVGIAETGSGKTIAFTLPALLHIKDQKPIGKRQGPIVLVLSPTRELAMQIAEVCTAAGQNSNIRTVCLYGGVEKGPQKKALENGCHIIVATPGRLLDFVNSGIVQLERVTYLVMDEADRMLDLGFEKDIKGIVANIRSDRQTLMFSATWPTTIQNMASEYLTNPVQVTIGSADLSANHKVTQIVEVIDQFARDNRLDQLLKQYHKSRTNRILIFVLYKKEATRVERMLQQKGWHAQALHGDVSQSERTRAMSQFKDGSVPLLVATDVAARGLDIPNVEYVINYSFPLTIEDYIHRIGRTGRGGKTGISHTMFTAADKTKGGELVAVLREANQEVPETLLKFGITTKKKEHALYGNAFREQKENEAPMKKTSHIKFD